MRPRLKWIDPDPESAPMVPKHWTVCNQCNLDVGPSAHDMYVHKLLHRPVPLPEEEVSLTPSALGEGKAPRRWHRNGGGGD